MTGWLRAERAALGTGKSLPVSRPVLAGPTSAISRRSRVAGQDARPASWLHARKARGVLLGGLILIGVGVAISAGVI